MTVALETTLPGPRATIALVEEAGLVNLRGGMGIYVRCNLRILNGPFSELTPNERELLNRRNPREVSGRYL